MKKQNGLHFCKGQGDLVWSFEGESGGPMRCLSIM